MSLDDTLAFQDSINVDGESMPLTPPQNITEQIIEFVSDAGEGAQTAGQCFGSICARMGNGIWTVEIIPAEVEPPRRSRAGASGNRVRFASTTVTNAGDEADLIVAFNEQVLYSRIDVGAYRRGSIILIEDKWINCPSPIIRDAYKLAIEDFKSRGYCIVYVPFEEECLKHTKGAKRGKNIWALGLLCAIYDRDMSIAHTELARRFSKKSDDLRALNAELLDQGYAWGLKHIDLRRHMECTPPTDEKLVVNGNTAIALGLMAAGIEVCSMYPITPATSISHHLAESLGRIGGIVHQAEDEIAAIGFAIGASFAGKTPVTITSGPGLALKSEFLALAVMAELPLLIIDVQRGGPSTGLPTRVEQGDLMAAIYGQPGDAPKIVIAPSTHEECFHLMITARKLAESFRSPVIILSDANFSSGQQPITRPKAKASWLAPPIVQSDWNTDVAPFAWDPVTGLSQRPIPGQKDGNYVVTGLTHDSSGRVAYESSINERSLKARSQKLITLQHSLKVPTVFGDSHGGKLLVVCWGSTRGAIEEAVGLLRQRDGLSISSLCLRFLSPLEPGLKEIFAKFKRVITIEMNYSDNDKQAAGDARRYAQLATLLRSHTLCDVDSATRVAGIPLSPKEVEKALLTHYREAQTL